MTHSKGPRKHEDFNAIQLSIMSPEQVLAGSSGEVTKPETINYRTQKPERDGLFCEKIFGPTKNWECYCGKYKRIRYKGVVCEKCGVEVTRSIVRRERMGHISLAVPVTHIWFLRSTPSRIGLLLDLPIKAMEQVIYFAAYVITEVDAEARKEALENLDKDFKSYKEQIQTEFKSKTNEVKVKRRGKTEDTQDKTEDDSVSGEEMVNIEDDFAQKVEDLRLQHDQAKEDLLSLKVGKVLGEMEYRNLNMKFGQAFSAGTGAESIRKILENMDLDAFIEELREERKKSTGPKYKKLIRCEKLAMSLKKANIDPAWMVITHLPVIPPDLRPMVQLDGGRFAASDLNDLYRRVINRNNRLKRLIAIGAPEVICRNEKRMLQEAVDTLFNNQARANRAVFTSGDRRKLRSLSDMLKGKQGRFRQNLLGKRVDYSGRSVIVVGPQLKLNECGLPKEMAMKLFKPFVIGEMIRQELAHNVKSAERLIESGKDESTNRNIWDILEKETKSRYVLLNRAPTLHRLGIQAFRPILIEGKAIQVHPLVCAAFNADFDGDQMAVHLPLSRASQKEAEELMLASTNLLKPSAGEPIITPSQDMVLGIYYLTQSFKGRKGEGMIFSNIDEAISAHEMGFVHLQALVKARVEGEIIETTVGRLIFNDMLPDEIPYLNQTAGNKELKKLLSDILNNVGPEVTARTADLIKEIGFKYATLSGITISTSDMIVPEEREELLSAAEEHVKKINNQYWEGWITEDERYSHAIRIWSALKGQVTKEMVTAFKKNPENNIYYMIDSGARGNWGQITQLCGMKGLVANPSGKTIELPIKSNLKGGFSILEYFIATHGGRKGKSDTALKTAEAGYLTRRLVDAVQDIVIKEEDCGNHNPHLITRKQSQEIGEDFEKRIFGRILAMDLIHPKTKKTLANKGEYIDSRLIQLIEETQIDEVQVRTVMTCRVEKGICRDCYGFDLGTNQPAELGTAAGIIAAQSIGEPGTQLTMRTFHMGGVAEGSDITQGLTRVEELFEARSPKSAAVLASINGKISIKQKKDQIEVTIAPQVLGEDGYIIPTDFEVLVKKGEKVRAKQLIARSKTEKLNLKAVQEGEVVHLDKETITIKHLEKHEKVYQFGLKENLIVTNGQVVTKGDPLTRGHLNLNELMESAGVYESQKYILREVQSIYASQGQTINDKHIEIIVKQMFSKLRISNPGDSPFLPGELVNVESFNKVTEQLKKENKTPPQGDRQLHGLTKTSTSTESWLSAASFQETIRVLVEAATTMKIDRLTGLKENVIIGKLIPAGEIFRRQRIKS